MQLKIIFLIVTVILSHFWGRNGWLHAQQWPIALGVDASSDYGWAIALDATGSNAVITGEFTPGLPTPLDFDPGAGSAPLQAQGVFDMFVAKYSTSNATYQWAFRIGAPGSACTGKGIAIDGSGNIYVTGFFDNTVDFNPSGGAPLTAAGGTFNDIFVAKYSSAGVYQWAFKIGGANPDEGVRIRTDGSGDVYVCGNFQGTADFNPGGGAPLTSAGARDGFVAKYTSAGVYQWAFALGAAITEDYVYDIALDATANVYVCGIFGDASNHVTIDFDPGAGNFPLTSQYQDGFVASYTNAGAYRWAFRIGEVGGGCGFAPAAKSDGCIAIAVDAGSNVYVTGTFSDEPDFDPGAGAACISNASAFTYMFVAKYTSASNYVWVKKLARYTSPAAIAVDNGNSTFSVTGRISNASSGDFDPDGGIVTLASAGSNDIFLASYTMAAGAYICAFRTGGTSNEGGRDMVVGPSGNRYITGEFRSSPVDFDPGGGTANLTNTGGNGGSQDIFAAVYNNACVIVLPVELLYLTSSCFPDRGEVILRWATASEFNNDYFTIEQSFAPSPSGEGWGEVGKVKGAGNSSTVLKYEFTDVSPLSFGEGQGERFYRLRQTDYDGKYEYSPVASVKFPCSEHEVTVVPNPSHGIFVIANISEGAAVNVYNILGEKIFTQKESTKFITVDLSDKPEGIYFIKVKTEKDIITQKIIIQK